jgi:hypothetical protein
VGLLVRSPWALENGSTVGSLRTLSTHNGGTLARDFASSELEDGDCLFGKGGFCHGLASGRERVSSKTLAAIVKVILVTSSICRHHAVQRFWIRRMSKTASYRTGPAPLKS